ncbi:hypothetical protein RCO27_10820 [Sphingosinicella sp. LHD-64]|uniref:hypothetical protein n=1 Tax=Sphingosinicella sp. LHD-64 TaxID=3072139 RepID=UPI0028106C31|nr:hypothetical protein [Sphingosinicella sp. LHD-64]MDQ8756720.1 hypothetical protein [Sphingosinicella sp. LHD-64]
MSKTGLIKTILVELRKAQREPWVPPPAGPVKKIRFPPGLPLEGGKHLRATDKLLKAAAAYSAIHVASKPDLRLRFKIEEFEQLVCRAFGSVLASLDLDLTDEALCSLIKEGVDQYIRDLIEKRGERIEFTAGCHLFQPCEVYPIRVGPVSFETRDQWVERALQDHKISAVTARRLRVTWSPRRLSKRKASLDFHAEKSVLGAIGPCDIICSVATHGLSAKMIREKALLASRLAMTAIATMWARPSQGLEWMNLLYDRHLPHRQYVLFAENRYAGSSSSISQMPSGRWTDAELVDEVRRYQTLFDQFGEALFNYVQPARGVTRPTMMNALFLSLWWHHEACRESSDQMATTKFAASMDALVSGQDAQAIMIFIEAQLGFKPKDPMMKDGQSTRAIINEIYNSRRSRLIHGSSSDFAHDWSSVRSAAESISRLCLVSAADWMRSNSEIDDLKLMSSIEITMSC